MRKLDQVDMEIISNRLEGGSIYDTERLDELVTKINFTRATVSQEFILLPVTEDIKKLMEIGKALNTQSNRGTKDPYFYTVHWKERDYIGSDSNYADGYIYANEECSEETYETYGDIPDDADKSKFVKLYYKEKTNVHNVWFTEEGIREYIKMMKHHYGEDAVDYMEYADNNPEMEAVIAFLRELGKINA